MPAQGIDSRPLHAVDACQSLLHQCPILTQQGHHVGDSPQGNQVDQVVLFQAHRSLRHGRLPVAAQQGLRQSIGDAHPGQLIEGVAPVLPLGVDHGHRLRQCLAHGVVVGDDDVDPQVVGVGDLIRGADTAVHGDDDADALVGQLGQCLFVQAVSFLPVGDVGDDLAAERAQRLDQEYRGGHPVGVEIAIHRDRLSRPQRLSQPGDGAVHSFEPEGIDRVVLGAEEGSHVSRVCYAAIVQHLDNSVIQVWKAGHVAGWGGWCDLPSFGVLRH